MPSVYNTLLLSSLHISTDFLNSSIPSPTLNIILVSLSLYLKSCLCPVSVQGIGIHPASIQYSQFLHVFLSKYFLPTNYINSSNCHDHTLDHLTTRNCSLIFLSPSSLLSLSLSHFLFSHLLLPSLRHILYQEEDIA